MRLFYLDKSGDSKPTFNRVSYFLSDELALFKTKSKNKIHLSGNQIQKL